jgi:putative redox protein
MSTAHIHYLGDLRTECVHTGSGSAMVTDAPLDNAGPG